jgi:hypothetical protein
MHVCVYIYTHTHTYTYVYVCVHTCMQVSSIPAVHTHTHKHAHFLSRLPKCACLHMHIHTLMHACIHTYEIASSSWLTKHEFSTHTKRRYPRICTSLLTTSFYRCESRLHHSVRAHEQLPTHMSTNTSYVTIFAYQTCMYACMHYHPHHTSFLSLPSLSMPTGDPSFCSTCSSVGILFLISAAIASISNHLLLSSPSL